MTADQRAVLRFIHDYAAVNGYAPNVREIAQGCAMSSTSVVNARIDELDALGYLSTPPDVPGKRRPSRATLLTTEGLAALGETADPYRALYRAVHDAWVQGADITTDVMDALTDCMMQRGGS